MTNQYRIQTVQDAPVQIETFSPLSYELAESLYAKAELDAFRDTLRAGLAKQVLDHTAMLIAAEEKCLQIAPSGHEEYRTIIEAYVLRAAKEIVRGEW